MDLPFIKINAEVIEAHRVDIEDLELLELNPTQLLIGPEGSAIALECDGQDYVYPVKDFEATVLSYYATGLSDKGHIPTIYELFKRTMEDIGMKLEKAVIEGKDGDVMYARLVWRDRKHRVLTTPCTVVDSIVHSIDWKAPLFIVKRAISGLDVVDGWEYSDEMEDYSQDDDDGGEGV